MSLILQNKKVRGPCTQSPSHLAPTQFQNQMSSHRLYELNQAFNMRFRSFVAPLYFHSTESRRVHRFTMKESSNPQTIQFFHICNSNQNWFNYSKNTGIFGISFSSIVWEIRFGPIEQMKLDECSNIQKTWRLVLSAFHDSFTRQT